MHPLIQRATSIATNRDSGAAALLAEALPLLAEAIGAGEVATLDVARTLCHGQPAMAPLWNAAAAALAEHRSPGRFVRVRAEMERAPAALARVAGSALLDAFEGVARPEVVTLSHSGSVAAAVANLASRRDIVVVCGESRPRFEGRAMAEHLARTGARVVLTTDAALASQLTSASAVVVGADAVAAREWINKVGTRALAAAAMATAVPVYVVASRDKALSRAMAEAWRLPEGPRDEVWKAPARAVEVRNPTFEPISVELSTLFLTESGALGPADLGELTERYAADISLLINSLG